MSVIVLLSGGLDSATLLYLAHDRGVLGMALWFRYAHPAAPYEYRATQALTHAIGAPLREVSLPLLGTERMATGVGAPGPRVLPARNQVMLSHAINVAAAIGHGEVWFGASGGDQAEYPDCRAPFVEAMNTLAQAWGVRVRAPLIAHSRSEVRAEALRLGVPVDRVWSCYQPHNGAPCGRCDSCRQG